MKTMKKAIAGLLATLMLATSFNFNLAFGADEYTDAEAIAVSKISAAGVMTGTDKGFEPTKNLTRAEAAAIIVRMKGIPESQINGAKGDTLFTDVAGSNWASGYINAASSLNIINGVGNGLFLPDREVTVIEFATMAIRALGAGQLVDSLGTWPTNYVNFAGEEGLLDGVVKVYTANASRMDAAFIAVNTLEAPVWEKRQVTNTSEVTYAKQESTNNNVTTKKTLLGSVLEISTEDSVEISNISVKDRTATFSGAAAAWSNYDIAESVDLATLKSGMEVDVWAKTKSKEIVRIAPAEVSKQVEVKFTEIKKIDTTKQEMTLVVNGVEKKYSYGSTDIDPAAGVQTATVVSYNTQNDPAYITTDADGVIDTNIKASENIFGRAIVEGKLITKLYAEEYTKRAVVKEIKNDYIYFEATTKVKGSTSVSKIDTDDDDFEYVVTKNGKSIDVTDIEEGDALYLYADGAKRLVIDVNNDTVEGEITNVATGKYVKIDGEKYDISKATGAALPANTGDNVRLYLDETGKVAMYEVLEGAVDSTVALVKSLRATTDKYGKKQLEIVLVQLDGTELEAKEIDLEETAKKLEKDSDELLTAFYSNNGTFTQTVPVTHTRSGLNTAACTKCGAAANDPCVANNEDKFNYTLAGKMIKYSTKGGKIVVTEFSAPTTNAIVSQFDDKKIAYFSSASYNESKARLGNYRLNENTVIYTVKYFNNSESKSAYSCKFEEIKFEDLGDSTGLAGYVLGVDENTAMVEAVLFTAEPSRTTKNNYAVVLDRSLLNDDDYSVEYDLLLADGSVVSVKVADDSDVNTNYALGTVIEAFITDDVLVDTNAVVAVGSLSELVKAYSFNGDGTVRVSESTSPYNSKVVEIAEDCIFVEATTADSFVTITKAKAGSEGDIVELASTENYNTASAEVDMLKVFYAKNTESNTDEIVAVFYKSK